MEELSQGIHKITIFYAERGAGVSNLKIRFNFPKTNQLDPDESGKHCFGKSGRIRKSIRIYRKFYFIKY